MWHTQGVSINVDCKGSNDILWVLCHLRQVDNWSLRLPNELLHLPLVARIAVEKNKQFVKHFHDYQCTSS